ncbi:hypothetical protein ACHAQF_009079 [Verticillium nonalfalfae]
MRSRMDGAFRNGAVDPMLVGYQDENWAGYDPYGSATVNEAVWYDSEGISISPQQSFLAAYQNTDQVDSDEGWDITVNPALIDSRHPQSSGIQPSET